MRLCIISDDLTGACDCGGQLIRYGLDVSVALNGDAEALRVKDAVIIDTDSRAVSGAEAYERVKKVCERIGNESFDVVYKKIDSTLRGNVGTEINAVYDVFRPDFVIIAPAYPENGRQVIDGVHFLNGKRLHETEVARDPKTPVQDSLVSRLIQTQAQREVGHLSCHDLNQGRDAVAEKLKSFKNRNISYITADSAVEEDLHRLVLFLKQTGYSVIWVGSAGLMKYLPLAYGLRQEKKEAAIAKHEQPVLLVIGSVSATGRKQLQQLLSSPNVTGIELESAHVLLDGEAKQKERQRVMQLAEAAFLQGRHTALFSSNQVEITQQIGSGYGLGPVEVSNLISEALGELTVSLIRRFDLQHLFLTGGDTAHQVFRQLQTDEFQLLDEVEPGVPLGRLYKEKEIFAVTKAGNFGTESVMIKAVEKLQGGPL
ncbi:four-carbon acid sugar kinase family protein [Paenibacillus hamazuiensis]|uniref:four-carbon acid sugar kinase family protein n=1 Tax=Paenibacillus hamazuiensis TaxID=2936508 RepID=UPI00200FEAEE|nr:four-carbon acid sugar kinase family protein [Paenibacillus hamazuiensis]